LETIDELTAFLATATVDGILGRLLHRGAAWSLMREEGVLPPNAPPLGATIETDLAEHGFALLRGAMALRAQAGASDLTSKAFERAANAFEARGGHRAALLRIRARQELPVVEQRFLFQLPGRVAALLDILDRTPAADRPNVLAAAQIPQVHLRLLDTPVPNLGDRGEPDAEAMRHRIEAALSAPRPVIVADRYRPADQKAGWAGGRVEDGAWIEAALADGQWLLVVSNLDPPPSADPVAAEFSTASFAAWVILSLALAALLSVVAARRLVKPLSELSAAVQSQRLMVWSAGASSIFANGCGTNFRSLSPSRPSAACCVRWAIASCQHVRAITLKLPAPLRYLKKVPLAVGKHRPQAARRYRRHRGLVR
jgi:hypothetical protein